MGAVNPAHPADDDPEQEVESGAVLASLAEEGEESQPVFLAGGALGSKGSCPRPQAMCARMRSMMCTAAALRQLGFLQITRNVISGAGHSRFAAEVWRMFP